MGRTFDTWVYTDDQGNAFNRKISHDIAIQMADGSPKIGGTEAAVVNPPLPRSFKPRVALCQDASHVRYRVTCFSADAALYTTPGTTINLYDRDGGAAVAVTSYGAEGERMRHKLLT